MEHSCMTMREAELLCRLINGNGMISLIRLPSGERDVALRAAETGVDMLMVPMINEPAELERFVSHTRYAPEGQRGFYRYSRALNYGLGKSMTELRRNANENLMLWGQVETIAALHRLHELCQVEGVDGLFMGPGDLSSAYGIPGQISDERVVESVSTGIATTREYGKCTGTVAPPADVKRWIDESADLLFVGGNVEWYVKSAEQVQTNLQATLAGSRTTPAVAEGVDRRIDAPHSTAPASASSHETRDAITRVN
jgi:4-hydroxy-2-oxoheptanedioate aldolase